MGTIIVRREPRGSPKKFSAFLPNGKRVRFGLRGYSDFTLHKDPTRMQRYVRRHGGKIPEGTPARIKNMLKVTRSNKEDWSPKGLGSPGFWSRWFLWSRPTLKGAAETTSKVLGVPVKVVA